MDPNSPGSPGREHRLPTPMPPPPTGEVVPPGGSAGLTPPAGSSWGPWSEGQPPAPTTRRIRRWLVVLLATLLVVGGGGSAAAFLLMRGAGEELLQLVPASSEVVVTAYLDPSAGQKVNLMALADRFPALRDDQRIGEQVDDVLDSALEGTGLSHEDVRPWLGSQVAIVVDVGANVDLPTVSFLVASKDDDAAREALDKALQGSLGTEQTSEYRGAAMHIFGSGTSSVGYVIVDHVVVLSNHSIGLTRVIDVSAGSALAIADDPAFQETISSLPEGKLGLAYVNPTEIVNRVLSESGLGAVGTAPGLDQLRAIRGVGATLSAHPDGLAFDVAMRLDPSKLDPATRLQLDQPVHENGVLGFVPADAYVVATQQGLDETLKPTVDQLLTTAEGEQIRQRIGVDDALAALTGDLAFEVGPGSGPVPAAGAILIGVRDASAVQRTLDGLADLTEVPKGTWRTSTYLGTTIRYLDDPAPHGHGVRARLRGGRWCRDRRIQPDRDPEGDRHRSWERAEHRRVVFVRAGRDPGTGRREHRVPGRGGDGVEVRVATPTRPRLEPRAVQHRGPGDQQLVLPVTYRLFIEIG